jgi:hypothetical protein
MPRRVPGMSIQRILALAGALAAVVGLVAAVRSRTSENEVAFPDAGGPRAVDTVEVVPTNQPTDAYGED